MSQISTKSLRHILRMILTSLYVIASGTVEPVWTQWELHIYQGFSNILAGIQRNEIYRCQCATNNFFVFKKASWDWEDCQRISKYIWLMFYLFLTFVSFFVPVVPRDRLYQCFSTFVRPRSVKFFFYKTRARSQQIHS